NGGCLPPAPVECVPRGRAEYEVDEEVASMANLVCREAFEAYRPQVNARPLDVHVAQDPGSHCVVDLLTEGRDAVAAQDLLGFAEEFSAFAEALNGFFSEAVTQLSRGLIRAGLPEHVRFAASADCVDEGD